MPIMSIIRLMPTYHLKLSLHYTIYFDLLLLLTLRILDLAIRTINMGLSPTSILLYTIFESMTHIHTNVSCTILTTY